MKNLYFILFFFSMIAFSQEEPVFKKRVLENVEVDFLTSFYHQDGDNAAVTGGIGTEELTDVTPTITIAIPLNDDDVLTIDAGISAYSSASSSNLDPFDSSGASGGGDGDDDDDNENGGGTIEGSPWVASSGASAQDVYGALNVGYSHSSDDRNKLWSAKLNFASEYDYISLGIQLGYSQQFNNKNTELSIKASTFIDEWLPRYPTEIDSYFESNKNTEVGFFNGVPIINEQGVVTTKNTANSWKPSSDGLIVDKRRNNYTVSLGFTQILSKNVQVALFTDIVKQTGWLANPMQRVYFADKANYYIGNVNGITNYTNRTNTNVFHLADDIERLPDNRLKFPVGGRLNYYLNERFVLRTYYRYYSDTWDVKGHTAMVELPFKISEKLTITPGYRWYNQSQAKYFAPYNTHLSTSTYYTSDYDLSEFTSNQYSVGLRYTDIFMTKKVGPLSIKTCEIKYSNYKRSTGLISNIVTFGIKFVME